LTDKQAPRRKVASSLLSATIVLVAVGWAHSSLAATDTGARCDQSMDPPPMSPADDGSLAIHVIDHGTANVAVMEAVPVEESAVDGSTGPRAEITLQRILDETRARQPARTEPELVEGRSTPLAVRKTDGVDEPTAVLDAEPADSTTEMPGFSADELLRYRQQMFRTDI
jgi:hypothetical protein